MRNLIYCVIGLIVFLSTQSFSQTDFPYGKLLNYTTQDFTNAKFKFNAKKNTWTLNKIDGMHMLDQISALAEDANAKVSISEDNYRIVVQLGNDSKIASIKVLFYKKSIYDDIINFAIANGSNITDTDNGLIKKKSYDYGEYNFRIQQTEVKVSESDKYNEFLYEITTSVNVPGQKANSVDAFY